MYEKTEATASKAKSTPVADCQPLNLKKFLMGLDAELWQQWREKYKLRKLPFYAKRNEPLIVPFETLLEISSLKSIFLTILTVENWLETPGISVADLKVGKSYVTNKIEALHSIDDPLKAQYQDEILTMLYFCIATRFYIEKTIHNIPIPSTRLKDLEEAKNHFENLKKTPGKELSISNNLGRKASNFFMEELRYKCVKDCNKSFSYYWNDASMIGRVVTYLKRQQNIHPNTFNRMRNDTAVSQFRPAAVKYLAHFIHEQDNNLHVENYLNLCGGWGDRLLGALATPSIKRYIETDPNPELLPVAQKIYETYDPDKETEVYLYDKPMEDLSIDELCPKGEKNDLVFFSPPYYRKEKYPGTEQSHKRYPSIESWYCNFLYKSLQVSYFALNERGILAINLADIREQYYDYKLTSCLVDLLDKTMSSYFMKFSEPMLYETKNCPNPSSVFIYQTKPYKDSLSAFPEFKMDDSWSIKKERKRKTQGKQLTQGATKQTPKAVAKPLERASGTKEIKTVSLAKSPRFFPVNPALENTPLSTIHRLIECSDSLEAMAPMMGCSDVELAKRITDWGIRLSFDKLKYEYRSQPVVTVVEYNQIILLKGVIYCEDQPIQKNKVYLSKPKNAIVDVLLINPRGRLIEDHINIQGMGDNYIPQIINILEIKGSIKKWVTIPFYSSNMGNPEAQFEHLSLTLAELHEIIRFTTTNRWISAKLNTSFEELSAKFWAIKISLPLLKTLTHDEALAHFQEKYYWPISQILENGKYFDVAVELVSSFPPQQFFSPPQNIATRSSKRKRVEEIEGGESTPQNPEPPKKARIC